MKTFKIGLFAMLGLLAVACNDDENNTAKLSSEEQAEMVASSMGQSGFAGSAEQSAGYAQAANPPARVAACGVSTENSSNLSLTLNGISLVYKSNFMLLLTCNGDQPQSFNAAFDYQGSYTGPKFESTYSGNGDLTLTQLSSAETSYKLDGSYERSGSFKVKANGTVTNEGQHKLVIQANSVMISKSSKQVTSGSATVSASGNINGRGNYSFNAEVTFSGTGETRKATINVAGDTYDLNIQTNAIVKVTR